MHVLVHGGERGWGTKAALPCGTGYSPFGSRLTQRIASNSIYIRSLPPRFDKPMSPSSLSGKISPHRAFAAFTMHFVLRYLRAYARRKHVRPWALAGPIIVLLICLPILRPLRHPLVSQMSDDELARWATVQALVEQQSFAIDQTQFAKPLHSRKVKVAEDFYSDQPPVLALLLSGPYWLIRKCGLNFSNNPDLVEYLLTLLAVTVPVAASAGLLYRMGRLFELRRPWRMSLALAVVLGSGLVSYATVLNPYAPAAALVLAAAAIFVQVTLVSTPLRSGGYLASAGLFASLAAAIDPAAVVFTILFIAVIIAMRWRWSVRIAGILMYAIGVVPPVLLHLSLSVPITGDWRLGLAQLPREIIYGHRAPIIATPAKSIDTDEDLLSAPPTYFQMAQAYIARLFGAFLGNHGLLTHFPILIVGGIGIVSVLRRHWPPTTKTLAVVTVAAGSIVLLRYVALPIDWRWAMFAVRWYVIFLPMVLFWAGAWLRKPHHPVAWSVVGVLLAFSITVALIGATNPMPRDGYDRYTAAAALHKLTTSANGEDSPMLAGR
jgi:hypothetical protein